MLHHAIAGAQAYAADTANSFTGNSTAFASATARLSIVRECLFNATIAASAEASASATAVSTAIAQANATSASQAITGAICNPVTATATAEAFAQAIATAQGCNGVIYEAISCKSFGHIRLLLHESYWHCGKLCIILTVSRHVIVNCSNVIWPFGVCKQIATKYYKLPNCMPEYFFHSDMTFCQLTELASTTCSCN